METAKEEVRRILESLPDDTTLEDIQYRIYVRQAIATGVSDVDEGRVVSQEDVERRMSRWTEK
jgi:predicted transcriptional regulator